MRKLMLFLALALAVVLFVAPAFAEVQNVKVGGDVNVRTLSRQNLDLLRDGNTSRPSDRGNPDVGQAVGKPTDDKDYEIMSTIGIDVNADLTDNVGVGIRLLNQRDWAADTGVGVGALGVSNARDKVSIDLASVTLKEFFYQPLSIVVGRQDLWFGKGFIIGSKMLAHPELTAGVGGAGMAGGVGGFVRGVSDSSDVDQGDAITADEYSDLTSFDAVRGTFDLNPWTIDVIYSIINNQPGNNDTYLYGANVGYKFDTYNAEMEGYYFSKYDRNIIPSAKNEVNTVGLRGSLEPMANMNLWLEGAYQFGAYTEGTVVRPAGYGPNMYLGQNVYRHRSAYAADAGLDYTWKDTSYQPKLGAEFIYYSGEENADERSYSAWDQMYRGKFDTLIREFQGGAGIHYGGIAAAANLYDTDDPYDQPSFTNQMQFAGFGAAKLMDAMNLSVKGSYFRAAQAYDPVNNNRGKSLGWELDTNLTYDYTEDVQFGLLTGWFFPGGYFNGGGWDQGGAPNRLASGGKPNAGASTVMTTMKVDF